MRWLRLLCVSALSAVLLLLGALLTGEASRHTQPFLDESGRPLPGSIARMERVELNGSVQEIWIRGVDHRAPLLVLLHGGPGASESALFRQYVPGLERHFVVVYWDQRGAGRSWLPDARRQALSTEQLLQDLDALVGQLTRRFGQERVALLGHSWGTVLGVLYAQRRPERISHYIGVAQVVNWTEAQRLEQQFVSSEARARGDGEVLRTLRDMPSPPLPVPAMLRLESLCERYGGVFHGRMRTHDLLLAAWSADESALLDLALFGLGNRFSLERLWSEYVAIDFLQTAPRLDVPVTLVLGRHDRHVAAHLAARWFDALAAPEKRLLWFEESAHNPPFEQPDLFVRSLAEVAARASAARLALRTTRPAASSRKT